MRNMSLDRRAFIGTSGLLVVAVAFPDGAGAAVAAATAPAAAVTVRPQIVISPSGDVKLWSPTSEMGQGTHTAHAAIIADELGLDIARVTIETAEPADAFRRAGPGGAPGSMASGGSMGVRFWAAPLRKAAAQAREMLVAVAATRLGVPATELRAEAGAVLHPASGRRLEFGVLAAEASRLAPPDAPALRPAAERRYVGSTRLKRLDIPAKVDGSAVFSADVRRPGMLFAAARLAPVRGADVARLDRASVSAMPGVLETVAFPGGAAVVATSQWAALRAADALQLEFTATPGDTLDSATMTARMREGLGAESRAVLKDDGFAAVRDAAARVITADYEVPYLNHAPMEPWSCTVERDPDGVWHLWAPTQAQDRARNAAARTLGVPVEQVRVHTTLVGGGFGRRIMDDGVAGAVLASRAMGGRAVKFFWSREGEFLAGYGRPCAMARLTAALDAEGRVVGLHVRTSGPATGRSLQQAQEAADRDTYVDSQALQHLAECRYRVGARRFDYAMRHNHFPVGPWRAVGATQNAFFLEVFIDEVALATGKDPLALRRELLAHDARALRVVDTVAARAGWGRPLPEGHALGLAYYESYGSLCAQVAEVSLGEGGVPRVHRIVAALDCGDVLTPDGVHAQMQGGVLQGLSAAMYEAATLAGGAAQQRNFDSYRLLRINEAPPVVETHIVVSGEPLGGVGEPPLPPTAPAVANALARLRGKPVRSLPLVTA
jgi:isoquinoline 1-oxidoreductase beta subunit